MNNRESIHKLESMRNTCQKLIDEKVKFERLVGADVTGTWETETPFDDALQNLIEALTLAIAALKQQEMDRWIQVSEQMPETTDEVLTTYITNGNRKKRYVETATHYPDDGEGTWSSPWDEYRVAGTAVEVLAWRPLPEPYQEDKA